MKKRSIFILSLVACLLNLGNYQSIHATEKVDGEEQCVTKSAKRTSYLNVTVKYETLDKTIKNNEGVPILEVQGNIPNVVITNNKTATCRLNAFYEKKKKAFEVKEKEYSKMAEQDYKTRTKEQKEYWHGYGLGDTYTTGRLDDKVLSFIHT